MSAARMTPGVVGKEAAAKELKGMGAVPFAGYCTDPCDGRTQGTPGMFDSLPYRKVRRPKWPLR